ncbi:MAG: family 10 glycosylhydrolase [Candidatus Saccharicenans sp.]
MLVKSISGVIKRNIIFFVLLAVVVAGDWLQTGLMAGDTAGQKLRPIKEPKVGLPARWVCGVWLHPGQFGQRKEEAAEKIGKTLDAYVAAGINSLFMMVKGTSGYVYFESDIGVKDPAYDWDFFGLFLEEARKRNLDVHPRFCVFTEGALPGKVREHPEWLVVGPGREMVRSVNPALPEVRAYEISLMSELAKKYSVDWIHLDYIRFPCEPTEPYFSHDGRTLKLFREETGIDFRALKARDSGNPYWNVWLEWNRKQVTRFVRELRAELEKTGRLVRISAAVFPDADNARVLIGQDWAAWAKEGLVDMLNPMLYTNDLALFEELTRRAVEAGKPNKVSAPGAGSPAAVRKVLVCPGIGIVTSHNQATPEIMLEEVRLARSLGADGAVFFSGGSLTEAFLDALSKERK